MFTGIIEGLGDIRQIRSAGSGRRISLETDFDLDGTGIGDSIAVNGACLTAVRVDRRRFSVDVSPETLSTTTLGRAAVGERVNIERALRMGDRLDGHLVSGHIDGIGRLEQRRTQGNAVIIDFSIPEALARYLVRKGSVAVDGISLTVNDCNGKGFQISVIPHTAKITTLGMRHPGDPVNIETDMIGKYVERFVSAGRNTQGDRSGIDRDFLSRTGFL